MLESFKNAVNLTFKINTRNKGEGYFKSKNYIKLGNPNIKYQEKDLIWPINVLESPIITIDDSESQILSSISDSLKIKIILKNYCKKK